MYRMLFEPAQSQVALLCLQLIVNDEYRLAIAVSNLSRHGIIWVGME